jgi:predicted phosphodiesterase
VGNHEPVDPDRLSHLAQREQLRLLAVGDTHGNASWVEQLCALTAQHQCEIILQVGDFGFAPTTDSGAKFLDRVDAACAANGIELWWIEGNHENHAAIEQLHRSCHGPAQARQHIWHLPRGLRLTLAGRRFGFLGGAFSLDWHWRRAGDTWWPDHELPTANHVELLGAEPLDVLVTHDAPAGIDLPSYYSPPPADAKRTNEIRQLLRYALDATQPSYVLHGHWHHRHTTQLGDTIIEGLDRDGSPECAVMVDLPSLRITEISAGGR